MSRQSEKTFFVGYSPMPGDLKKFFVAVAVVLNIFALLAGYTIANQQKNTGPAVWLTERTQTYTGLLKLDPYPVLHRVDAKDGKRIQSILLVNQGKFSADEHAFPHRDQMVSVTGYEITRGGWTMLELVSDNPIEPADENDPSANALLAENTETESLGPVTLKGEIADSKCFLGVMKPGAGSVHKACAEVCLLGGIPAMLLVRSDDGKKYGYMLTRPDGSSLSKDISKKAADTVEISGHLEKKGDLLYIRAAENSI